MGANERSAGKVHAPRRRGRPSRLSHATIIDAALDLLSEEGLQAFTLAKLAARLGAGVMTLYTYFPSRDSLLDAAAEHVFASFVVPEPSSLWQADILSWLRAISAHLRRHPAALEVIAWESHISSGWLRVWAPVVGVLANQGLTQSQLAFAATWFSRAALGLIYGTLKGPDRLHPDALAAFGADAAGHHPLLELSEHGVAVDVDAVLEFGFRNIVSGLEQLVGARCPS